MNRNDSARIIYNRALTIASLSDDRIIFDGDDADEPVSGTWCRVTVRHGSSPVETFGCVGNRKYQRNGKIFIQVFGDLCIGRKPTDMIAEDFVDIFEGESFSGINVTNVDVREIGAEEKWYAQIVECDFNFEVIK